ncbi:MAG: DHH family phosphoesterase [Clostridia bacterium]|nr:DHH family phosphoesterase [Clostridia bacterium]
MKSKYFLRRLNSAMSVAQWCVLVCAVLTFVTSPEQYGLAIAEAVLFLVLVLLNFMEKKYRAHDVAEYAEKLSEHMDSATKDSLMNFPFPMVVTQLDGKVSWYNQDFAKIVKGESLYDKYITEIVENLKWGDVLRMHEGITLDVVYNESEYSVSGSIIKPDQKKDGEYLVLLYWLDVTETNTLRTKYLNEKTDVAIIMIDNYDDVMNNMEDSAKPQLISMIDRKVNEWLSSTSGILKKTERDRYLYFFEHRYLNKLIDGKFSVLERVRELNEGNKAPVTISIGIGTGGEDITVNDHYSRMALDMALGRGGDQAVIKDETQFKFFGGKTKEHEKSTRVKSRVIAYALRQLITSKQRVVIMGHKNPDFDTIGAAVGLSRAVKNRKKPVYIVCGEHGSGVEGIIQSLRAQEDCEGMFIQPHEADALVDDDTLLIVVDTHRPSMTENSGLLEKAGEIIMIDHHRRSTEFIENCSLVYHEPYASSACEMVAELLQYTDSRVALTRPEAEAVYAGICLDTKHFTFKTGVRTFDAASFLRKHGVDTTTVKRMFQSDLAQYNSRSAIVSRMKMVREGVAISVCEDRFDNPSVLAAQAADEMLNLDGVECAFAVVSTEEMVFISGRSWGKVNVQVILEKLGGGGHMTVAGAQLRDLTLEDARQQLETAITEYFSEQSE